MNKFKVGDFIFCEFVLQQIKEMNGEDITCVTDGHFQMTGNSLNDRCYPLDLRIKVISDSVKSWSKRFHDLKNNSLNYPDINRELIRIWVEMCEIKDNDTRLKELFNSLDSFGRKIEERVRDLKYEEIDGVPLFRR